MRLPAMAAIFIRYSLMEQQAFGGQVLEQCLRSLLLTDSCILARHLRLLTSISEGFP